MDHEEFRRTVQRHKDRVHSYASWMLRDAEEAQDVAQEALLRLWTHRHSVDGSCKGWLLRTTHNLCIDRIRRRRARPEVGGEALAAAPAVSKEPGPYRLAAAGQAGERIALALEGLSPRDRALVLLREVEGMSYEEIASALGIPMGTMKAALHRAREKLRVALARAGVQP